MTRLVCGGHEDTELFPAYGTGAQIIEAKAFNKVPWSS